MYRKGQKKNIYTMVYKLSLLYFSGLLWSLQFALKKWLIDTASNTDYIWLFTRNSNLLFILVENASLKNRLKSDTDLVTTWDPTVKSDTELVFLVVELVYVFCFLVEVKGLNFWFH